MNQKPLVSIVVPTRNSASTLEVCLESIKKQRYPSVEVLIVDNYSVDGTNMIVEKYGAKSLLRGPERSSQRNYGAKHSCGDYLFFVDSDMELTPNVVDECVQKIMNGFDGVVVPEKTVGDSFWVKARGLERMTYFRDTLYEAARFFRRNVFEELEGYDEEITGTEDCDLQARLEENGYKIAHVDAVIIHHEEGFSLSGYLMKRYYYVKNSRKYLHKHPKRVKAQFAPVRLSYFKHWKLFLRNPFYGLGLVLLKICDFAVFFLGLMF